MEVRCRSPLPPSPRPKSSDAKALNKTDTCIRRTAVDAGGVGVNFVGVTAVGAVVVVGALVADVTAVGAVVDAGDGDVNAVDDVGFRVSCASLM